MRGSVCLPLAASCFTNGVCWISDAILAAWFAVLGELIRLRNFTVEKIAGWNTDGCGAFSGG